MAIENATFITDLNPLYPLVNDPIGEGDDHLRQNKAVMQNTFPNADGAITPTAVQFNKILMSEQNYDRVETQDPDDFREPVDIDENIKWHDDNLEARVEGTRFADGTYDPDEPKPSPLPEQYPNDLNLYSLAVRIADIESKYGIPVNGIHFSTSPIDPGLDRTAGGLGYGVWSNIAQGQFIAGIGTGIDQNSVSKTISSGLNAGEYEHTLTIDEMPSHTHNIGTDPGSTNVSGDKVRSESQVTSSSTTDATGGGLSHNILAPHFGLYIFKRTS